MASANSNQNVNDKLVIFKGDDTGGVFGRRLAFTIEAGEGIDLSGCRAEWIFDGIVKTFDAPLIGGETREVFYSHNETERMCIGVRYGTFRIIDAEGKRATMTNTRAVEVTDNVARCYPGASAATVRIGTFISWENISGKPILVKTVNGESPDASGNINIEIEEQVLDDTVTEESPNGVKSSGIWSWVKSLLPHWLTSDYAEPATVASVADKRDKSDLAVYSVTRTENTDWTWTSENKELEAALNAEGIKIKFHDDNMMWNAVADPSGWAFAPAHGTKSDLSVVMYFIKGPEWIDQYPATATRPRYMDETLGPEKPNQQLAAVATDDAAKPADGSLMKYDAANDRFVKATAGTDYIKTHQDISGKFDATHDFDGQSASLSWDAFYLAVHAPYGLYVLRGGMMADEYDQHGQYVRTHSLFQKADRATTLSGYGITDAAKLAMLLPPAFVAKTSGSYEEGEIVLYDNAAYKRNATAGDDTSWVAAHWTSATDADLAARLKCLKNNGFATDTFATDLLGKQVAISAMRYGLVSTDETVKAADRTVTKVTLGTTAVTVTFPDADENGKTRDFLLRIDAANLSTGGSLNITKPTGATIYGDAFPSPEATKQYLVAITETAANEFYVRTIEITIPTEA